MSAPLTRTRVPGIYKRGSRYIVREKDAAGRLLNRSAPTLNAAIDLKAQIRADNIRGELRDATHTHFDVYAREWIETYAGRTTRGFKDSTRTDYRRALENHAIPFFNKMPLAHIEPRDVKRFATKVAAKGLSRDGVRNALAPVKAMLATAFEDGDIRVNPAANVRIMTADVRVDSEQRARSLSQGELNKVLGAVDSEHAMLITFVARTGLRIGELIALRWHDINLDAPAVHVRRSIYRGMVSTPKSRYGIRTVPLTARLAGQMRAYRLAVGTPSADTLVFPSDAGTPLSPRNVLMRVMKPAAKAAGVEWAGLHTLRHTFASECFRNGCNAKQVQMLLGHHSAAFTLETYIHLLPEDMPSLDFLDSPAAQAATQPQLGKESTPTRPVDAVA